MKKIFVFITIFFTSIFAKAQMEVVANSFKEVPGFVFIDHEVTDINNLPYSVIKLRTQNIDDKSRGALRFYSDAATEVETGYKVGEVHIQLYQKKTNALMSLM